MVRSGVHKRSHPLIGTCRAAAGTTAKPPRGTRSVRNVGAHRRARPDVAPGGGQTERGVPAPGNSGRMCSVGIWSSRLMEHNKRVV